MHDHEKNHVAAGWDTAHDLRWIEVGHLRLEEKEKDGATAILVGTDADPSERRWIRLSATELVGLARHLTNWFADDPAEEIRQIEACATFVKSELKDCDVKITSADIGRLTRTLDTLLAKCGHLRETGLLFNRPPTSPPFSKATAIAAVADLVYCLSDAEAKLHPAHQAFCRQMRERVYSDEQLNDAWTAFKHGWDSNGGDV